MAFNNPLLVPPVLPTTSPTASVQSRPAANVGTSGLLGTPQCNLFWVKNLDGVMSHPTSPNEHLYFGSEEEPILYVRETDGTGQIKSPIKILRYTIEEMPIGPEAQFVTKDEHKQLYSLVEKLSGNVESMNQKLEKLLNG